MAREYESVFHGRGKKLLPTSPEMVNVGPRALILGALAWARELFSCGHRKPCGECGKQRVARCGTLAWIGCEHGGLMIAILAFAAVVALVGLVVIGA